MKFVERLLAAIAWLQIAVSPAIVGVVAGIFLWLILRSFWGITLGILFAAIGFVSGIVFAEKARRDKGTIEFMSRNIAHP